MKPENAIHREGERQSQPLARILVALSVLLCAALSPRVAAAQQKTFYLDRIQISGAPDDGFVAWRPALFEKTRFYGAIAMGYTLNPLRSGTVVSNPNAQESINNPITGQLITYLSAGMEFAGRFSVGAELPFSLWEGTNNPSNAGIHIDPKSVAAYDLRLSAKLKIYQSDDRKLQLGLGAALTAPTGNTFSFGGDGQSTGYLYGAAEYDFGKFQIVGNLGPQFRPSRGVVPDQAPGTGLDVDSELRWVGTIFFPMRQGDIRLGGSLWGTTGIVTGATTGNSTFFSTNNTDLEWLGEIRILFDKKDNLYFTGGGGTRLTAGYGAPDIRLLAMLGASAPLLDFGAGNVSKPRRKPPDVEMHDLDTDGDGYPDSVDDCPTEKEDGAPPNPTDGCPAPKDRDKDGIPDDADKCPDQPEDKDGIMDDDGCPEKDADNDGIPDEQDACPLVPGVPNKDPKKNGCKEDHKKIVETAGGIQLLEPIQFDTGKASIKSASFGVLDEVVDVLKSRPDVRMGVYGNTDSHGARAMNTSLSKNRAAAVVNYLVSKGIARTRLESDGFGPDKPIDTNDTEEGRAKNRRVEFKVLE